MRKGHCGQSARLSTETSQLTNRFPTEAVRTLRDPELSPVSSEGPRKVPEELGWGSRWRVLPARAGRGRVLGKAFLARRGTSEAAVRRQVGRGLGREAGKAERILLDQRRGPHSHPLRDRTEEGR